jgi:hypothetical protein
MSVLPSHRQHGPGLWLVEHLFIGERGNERFIANSFEFSGQCGRRGHALHDTGASRDSANQWLCSGTQQPDAAKREGGHPRRRWAAIDQRKRPRYPHIPTRQDFEALQDQQLSEMSDQLASLKNENSQLRAELASLRADVERINTAMRPPAGYTAAFTTKRNWDGLEDSIGIKYYAPYGR